MKKTKSFLPLRHKDTKFFFVSLCLSGTLFFSCIKKEEKIPPDIIPKNQMVELLVDFHLSQAQLQLKSPVDNTSALKESFYKYIFQKHKTNYNQLKKNFDYYASHPDVFSSVYEEVIVALSKKQAEAPPNLPPNGGESF